MQIKELIKFRWIFQQVFGDLLDKLVYDIDIRRSKEYLKALGYKDIDDIFPDEVDKKEFNDLSKKIFQFYETKDPEKT